MGTNCAPLLAELLLHVYESSAMLKFSRDKSFNAQSFNYTRRYIDDLLSIDNPQFKDAIKQIYPEELELKDTSLEGNKVAYLDRLVKINNGLLLSSLYDKRDDFPFTIRNYPHMDSNIPVLPTYGVYISQIIRFTKACDNYEDFVVRHSRLVNTLLNQGFEIKLLYRKFKQFYRTNYCLVSKYSKSVTEHIRDGIDSRVI